MLFVIPVPILVVAIIAVRAVVTGCAMPRRAAPPKARSVAARTAPVVPRPAEVVAVTRARAASIIEPIAPRRPVEVATAAKAAETARPVGAEGQERRPDLAAAEFPVAVLIERFQ